METKDKQSRTEKLLLAEMYNLGLRPKPQYKISKHRVDFAFPEVDLVVEVDGIYHRTKEQKETDRKREDYEEVYGWKIMRFNAEDVYKEPKYFAKEIKDYINRVKRKNEEEEIKKTEVLETSPILTKRTTPKDIVISFVIFIIILAIIFQLKGGGYSVFQNQSVRIYGLMFVILIIGYFIYITIKKIKVV